MGVGGGGQCFNCTCGGVLHGLWEGLKASSREHWYCPFGDESLPLNKCHNALSLVYFLQQLK